MLRNRFYAVIASVAVLAAFLAFTLSSTARAEEAQPPAPAQTAQPSAQAAQPSAQAAQPTAEAVQPPAEAVQPSAQAAQPTAEAAQAPAPAAESLLPDMAMGNADAPVTIIEYSSLSCSHCAWFDKEVLPELKSKYIDTGKVRYVMREFSRNEADLAGAVAARCLDPSRYFPFMRLLFSKQADWAFKDDALTPLKALAKQAGLSAEEFDKCIDNEAMQKKLLALRDEGQKKGVNATPSLFVNGMMHKGPPTLEALIEAMKPYLDAK